MSNFNDFLSQCFIDGMTNVNMESYVNDAFTQGRSVVLVGMQNGELMTRNISPEEMFIGFDPALSGADETVFQEFTPVDIINSALVEIMNERRFIIDVPEPKSHPYYYQETNHPDGWYRKFEKRQRGPKNVNNN